jgi:hypothetical protein
LASEAIAMVVSCYFGGENFYFAPQFFKDTFSFIMSVLELEVTCEVIATSLHE